MTAPSEPAPAASTSQVRDAGPDDVPHILRLIRELAQYEHELDKVEATQERLHAALFADDVAARHTNALVAEVTDRDGTSRVVGMAVWYVTFSTWTGLNGIWLEDLFVEPEQRGNGLGRGLLARLAQICVDRGYRRLEWWVLDWNEPAIGFYRSLGAVAQDEWTVFRVDGAALADLAGRR
jgi:GNAT superfamily N-acetyltransferase